MLSGTPPEIAFSAPPDPARLAQAQAQAAAVNTVSFLPVAPFALEQTFLLHSLPDWQTRTDVKTIYLDFDGFITQNTSWNTGYNLQTIVTPDWSLDGDYGNFSDIEKGEIQYMWEQVSEDFRPFDVDVTTQDPGVANLINAGGGDQRWGIRVAIGGSDLDWQRPVTNHGSGGIAVIGSFNDGIDQPCFAFAADFGPATSDIAEVISHETGHTLGLLHDGEDRFYFDSAAKNFVRVPVEYYGGHPTLYQEQLDPMTGKVIGWDFFANTRQTDWAPIMGVGYGMPLTQWSSGEYPGANNIEDDLSIITGQNGFGYRADDHGDLPDSTATPLEIDPLTADSDVQTYLGDGIIGEHPAPGVSDADVFSFTVEGIGEVLNFDITPFVTGANQDIGSDLDVLAKLYDSSGHVIGTSNPRDYLSAGSQTLNYPNYSTIDPDYLLNNPDYALFVDTNQGWRVQLDAGGAVVTNPDPLGTWTNVSDLILPEGTYYLSVEGTGRVNDFIDPNPNLHPIKDPKIVNGKPILPPDASDWGYSNYGSLGYYTIVGTRKKGLVVGVDFDVADGGTAPPNWNSFTGNDDSTATLTGLISEAGTSVPYTLSISTTGTSIDTFSSDNGIDITELPTHDPIPLDDLAGFISGEGTTTTFTWGNLEPWSYHTVYVFGHADFAADNVVTITGGNLNGTVQTISFEQIIAADGLVVNDIPGSDDDLSSFAVSVLSDGSGEISISVTNGRDLPWAIAGLAIVPTRPIGPAENGSISGQKWDDGGVGVDSLGAGNQIKDAGELGLAGWIMYIDENNDGVLNSTTTGGSPDQTLTVATNLPVPQPIPDQDASGVKSSLDFTGVGTIEDITVSMDISHTWDSDLKVELISPTGTHVKLVTRRGADGDNFHNTVFDDSASTSIITADAPFTGTYRPEEPLSILNGEEAFVADHPWQLWVRDLALGDTGVVNSWSITIKVKGSPGTTVFTEPNTVTDINGNYSFNDLPPGLYRIREYFQPDQVAAGWKQTWAPTPITVTSGSNIQDWDFGNWIPDVLPGSIQGQKYDDANQDGVKDEGDPGQPGWVVYIDSNNNGTRDISPAATVIESTDVPKPIQDLKTVNSQVTVNELGSVFNVEVTLDITHTFVGDLEAHLTSPSGRQILLFSGRGGQYNDFHSMTFSDSAERSIDTIGFNDLPYTGAWKPEEPLSTFGGDDAAGIWTLSIFDKDQGDEGILNSWSLSFGSSELYRTTDADGNYQFDNIFAGNYVVREEAQPGWTQIPPADTTIPGATWDNTHWNATVVAIDNPSDPDGSDSHRNVRNVDFGGFTPPGSISGYVYRDLDSNATKAPTEPGLPGWTVFLDANNNGNFDTGTLESTVESATIVPITSLTTVTSKVWFGSLAKVSDVIVSLDISHTFDSDLTAYLISPSGTRVKLFSGVGESGDDFSDTMFDDHAFQAITDGSAPFDDEFMPAEPFSAFKGQNATGYWTLEIQDTVIGDDGTLNDWSLTILGDELSTTTDAQGHYSFANLPPNTYHLNVVQHPLWTRTETAGPVTLSSSSQNVLNANFGNRPDFFAGDFNVDGFVDQADFVVWRRQFGRNVPAFTGADGDGDGDVDQDDLNVWRHNFGKYRDDHGNTAPNATLIVIPSTTLGEIETEGDVDILSFTASAGESYHFEMVLNSLASGILSVVGTNGTTALISDVGGVNTDPAVDWTATSNGIYFVKAEGSASAIGSYSVHASIDAPGAGSSSKPASAGGGLMVDSITAPVAGSSAVLTPAGDGLMVDSTTAPVARSSTVITPAGGGFMVDPITAPLLTATVQAFTTGPQSSLEVLATTTDSVSSVLSADFLMVPQGPSAIEAHDGNKLVSQPGSNSVDQNDMALLAWLAASGNGDRSRTDLSLSDDDLSTIGPSDEAESVDVAFELLEGNALASAAI